MGLTKEQAKDKVRELVQSFKDNIEQYKLTTYKEAEVRKVYIDPLFTTLGWDVSNEDKNSEQYKDVVNEDAIKIGGNTKTPDYSFRIGGTRIFFVEAKKWIGVGFDIFKDLIEKSGELDKKKDYYFSSEFYKKYPRGKQAKRKFPSESILNIKKNKEI